MAARHPDPVLVEVERPGHPDRLGVHRVQVIVVVAVAGDTRDHGHAKRQVSRLHAQRAQPGPLLLYPSGRDFPGGS